MSPESAQNLVVTLKRYWCKQNYCSCVISNFSFTHHRTAQLGWLWGWVRKRSISHQSHAQRSLYPLPKPVEKVTRSKKTTSSFSCLRILVSLSKDVFERRTSTGRGLFAFLSSSLVHILRQIVSINVRTLSNSNLVVTSHIKRNRASLPVDSCHSKTPWVKRITQAPARKNRHPPGKWLSYHLPLEWQFLRALT